MASGSAPYDKLAVLRELRTFQVSSRDCDSMIIDYCSEKEAYKLEAARDNEDFYVRCSTAARFIRDACMGRFTTDKARSLECCSMSGALHYIIIRLSAQERRFHGTHLHSHDRTYMPRHV